MQENLGITLMKVALLVVILFVLTLNTCQMTSIEERYNEVNRSLTTVNESINKLEDRVNNFSDSPVNIDLKLPSNMYLSENKDDKINASNENQTTPEEVIKPDDKLTDFESIYAKTLGDGYKNPLSMDSLVDFAYYNQDITNWIIGELKYENPEKYSKIDYTPELYSDFRELLEEYSELRGIIMLQVIKLIEEPMKQNSFVGEDNRDELLADDADFRSELSIAYFDDPKTFNPLTSSESQFSRLISWVNDRLCMRDPKNPDNYIGLLAEKVAITDDYKCYTFWLKPGVKWNKPQLNTNLPTQDWLNNAEHEVTAEDFAFTLSMIYNPAVQCDHIRNYYLDTTGRKNAKVIIINRYLFQIIWGTKTYQSKVFSLELYPWPKFIYGVDEFGNPYDEASIGKMFNDHWLSMDGNIVGCGPYILTRYRKAEEMHFTRNENYHSVMPPVKKLVCKILSDNNLIYRTFKERKVDMTTLSPSDWKRDVRDSKDEITDYKNGNIKLEEFTGMSYYYIGWNNENPLFTDPKVRRAMTHACNRQKFVDNVYYGLATVVTGNFWNESPFYDKSIKPYEFSLQKASELLDEAGWTIKEGNTLRSKIIDGDEKFFSFVMVIVDGSDEYLTTAKIFSEDLKEIGIEMTPKPTKWSAMLRAMDDGDFEAIVLGWALSYDPDPWQIWHSSEADKSRSSNYINFRNEKADKIIEELRVTFDRDERIRLCHEFHKLMHELQPYTFFISRKNKGASWKWVKNFTFGKLYPTSYRFPLHTATR